jgi:hypothetical protein
MFGETGVFSLNQTALVLLGIAGGTTAAGSIVDTSQKQQAGESKTS